MQSVKVGQLRSWNGIDNFHFIVVRVGPDSSEPNFVLREGEAELMYPRYPGGRHSKLVESIERNSLLLEDPR